MALQFAMLLLGVVLAAAGLWLMMRYRRRPVPCRFDDEATPATFFAAEAQHQTISRWSWVGSLLGFAGAMLMAAADHLPLLQGYIHYLHL